MACANFFFWRQTPARVSDDKSCDILGEEEYCHHLPSVTRALEALMAATLPKNKRPTLLSKLEGHSGAINAAVLVPGENAVMSVSDDK